ncbi:MAG: M48 family metallopeptidase [Salinarimonas sp.]
MLRLMRIPLLFRRAPQPDRITVAHAGTRYEVALKRSARARRLTLRVSSATGEVVATVPQSVAHQAVTRFVEAHAGWIATRVAKLPERVAFVAGALVPVRGVPHRIVHVAGPRAPVRVNTDETGAPVLLVACDPLVVQSRVRDFLRREATRDLAEAVARHTARLGIPARKITLRDTRSRWGSCSAKGHLSFSWRLIMAPAFVLDYLAAHEVAHLKEMNHSHRFWRLAESLCPRLKEAEAWLTRHGAELYRYGA